MTIAEKRANEYYPELNEQDDVAAWHGFIAGYEQAKKDMLKEAVEGTITCQNLNRYILVPGLDESLIYGDKVRIIVIPNTDEK